MSSAQNYNNQFCRADVSHDGTIDEQKFRQWLGPVIKAERRLSGSRVIPQEGHEYSLGAPNIARKSNQYDPAGTMFNQADVNADGRIDPQESMFV